MIESMILLLTGYYNPHGDSPGACGGTLHGFKESDTTECLSTAHRTLITNLDKDFENNYRLTAFMNTVIKIYQSNNKSNLTTYKNNYIP